MYKRIVVPLDGTKASESILSHAESMAIRYGAEIVLLYVQKPPIMLGWDEVIDEKAYRQMRKDEREAIESCFLSHQARLQTKGIKASYCIRCGETLESIIAAAEEREGSLIAMTTKGCDYAHESMPRSIAAGMLRKGHVPMLLLTRI